MPIGRGGSVEEKDLWICISREAGEPDDEEGLMLLEEVEGVGAEAVDEWAAPRDWDNEVEVMGKFS